MQAPRDGDAQQTVLGPKVQPKPAAPASSPNDSWRKLPAHPGWVQNPVTRAVKRSDQ